MYENGDKAFYKRYIKDKSSNDGEGLLQFSECHCLLVEQGNVYYRVNPCPLMKKKAMSFDYAETSEINSKDASIQRRLPQNNSVGENDDCADVESEEDDGSDVNLDNGIW